MAEPVVSSFLDSPPDAAVDTSPVADVDTSLDICSSMSNLAVNEHVKKLFCTTSTAQSNVARERFRTAFERSFAILSHPDAQAASLGAFILEEDVERELAFLSDDTLFRHASVISLDCSEIAVGIGNDDAPPSTIFDSEVTFDVLMVPVRVEGVLSYGVMARRANGAPASCSPDGITNDVGCGRFVRNEATGELLVVGRPDHRNKDSDTALLVLHTRLESATKRVVMKSKLNKVRFSAGAPAAAALYHSSLGNYTRFCPTCRSSPHAHCGCPLPLILPTGPNDLATVALNTNQLFGDWIGKTTMTLRCPMNDRFATADVMARQTSKAPSQNMQLTLRSEVMQSRFKLVHPSRTAMAWSPGESGPGISGFLDDAGADSLLLRNPGVQDQILPTLDDFLFGPDVDNSPMFFAPEDFSQIAEQRAVAAPEELRLTDGSFMMELPVQPDVASDEAMATMIVGLDEEALFLPVADAGGDLLGLPKTSPPLSNVTTSSSLSDTPTSRSARSSSTPGASAGSSSKLIPMKPTAGAGVTKRRRRTPAVVGSSGSDSDEANPEDAEAIARQKAIRVEKNRAAARVSNARRKERNLNLRRDLSFFRERLQTLTERQHQLRLENEALKARASLAA